MARLILKALDEAFPTTRHQRCWLHKTLNAPTSPEVDATQRAQGSARDLAVSEPGAAEAAMTTFAEKYAPKYDKAVECLIKERPTLLMFFDLPADHWDHLRTSNPIESVFATVRHRTVRMKGALSQDTARLMVFKLVMAASTTRRRLQGQNQLLKVVNGDKVQRRSKLSPKSNPPLDLHRHRFSRIARSPHRKLGPARRRDRRLAVSAKPKRRSNQLDVLHRQGQNQNGACLSRSLAQRVGTSVQRN